MASIDGEFDNAASTSYNAYATPSILRLKTLSTATATRQPTTTIQNQKQKQQQKSKSKLKKKLKLRLSKALSGPKQSLRPALQAATLTVSVLFVSSLIAITSAAVSSAATHDQSTDIEATLLVGSAEKEDPLAETFPELFNSSVLFLLAAVAPNGTADVNDTSSSSSSDSSLFSIQGTYDNHGVANAISYATSTYDFISDSPSNASAVGPLETEMPEDFTVPPVETILINIIMLFIILGTIVGNVLVCIAVCMVRKLRRPCNYLLVSLALSDLCVAVLVMPIALLYEITEKWTFGTLVCDLWVSFDVLCCTASILNLCAISVDRYLAITKPLEYGVKRTPRRMMACVALVWLAAACISLPPVFILGNEHVDENGRPICQVCQNSAYQIYATLGSFYIPLAVMLFVYFQIFRAARRIVLEEKRAQTHLQHALNGTGSPPPLPLPQPPHPPPPGTTDLGSGNGQQQQQHRHSSYGNTSLNYSTCGTLSVGQSSGGGLLGSPHHKKLRFQLAKEKKASTTLGIIMSAFVICWLPFFILALIRPFIESETLHVPKSLSSLFLWLGYANSLLNPIIYATLNRDFRKPFQEILYFRCSSLNTMMRENYYQDQYGEPPSQRVMLGDERHGARESFL